MTWMNITCGKCGHQADIDEFTHTPISGPLPKNTFQCPTCMAAIERRTVGPGKLYESGLYVPGPVKLVAVDSRL
ncbi:hypothetical protein MJO47_09255 [Desulfuromonas sp. KJ2020]|uniref:hypothetical protein n=1 Tax=Desulfuromonas sp. KJ2020 TaxID=2919173 RepID=UPI0020A724C2|nr:hypothetical protein [Desulfuromonas sp. KJ2020]MCP3177284.1 hypothetical protein [Desulfuromonas sp. KJ2020]